MYKRILVPLDGSPLAEDILPVVANLARKLNARVTLLSVVEENVAAAVGSAVSKRYRMRARTDITAIAESYVQERASHLNLPDGQVQTHVVRGKVADAIITEAPKRQNTFIAMSTHGRSGLGRFAMGSVADKVLHATKTPLLLYRSGSKASSIFVSRPNEMSTVIVPLDGSELAEQVLPHVIDLATTLPLRVDLVRVSSLPTISVYGQDTFESVSQDILDADEKEAQRYLAQKAEELSEAGCREVVTHFFSGDPSLHLIALAKKTPRSFVALTTHGRSGLSRWILGSVAERIIQHGGEPVLVIRPK